MPQCVANHPLQVLDATEKGLESLRANLESLSKVRGKNESTMTESQIISGHKQVVHEQRVSREQSHEQSRAPSPEGESNKKLV